MTGKPWLRLYAEFVSDPKVQLLAFEDQRHFVMLLCLKCNGTLDASAATDYREKMIAKALGLDLLAAAEARRRLMEVRLIDEHWQPVAWSRRQYESDSSVARTYRWRQRKRQERHGDVTVTDKSKADKRNKSDGPHIKAAAVWAELISSDGSRPPRTEKLQAAINAVGGWPAIKGRTRFEDQKLQQQFCAAYAGES